MPTAVVATSSMVWNAETEYASAVVQAERRIGFSVVIAAPAGSPLLAAARGAETVELPGRDPDRSPADLLADQRALSDLLRSHAFDVAHSSRQAAHVALALAAAHGPPLVHLRGSAQRPKAHASNRFLYRRLTDAVIASSGRVAGWVTSDLGVPADRVRRILAPVDVDRFAALGHAEARSRLGWDEDRPVIVDVARLAPVKGQATLIEALPIVLERFPEATLRLVGEPWSGEMERLGRLADSLGVASAVEMTGRVDDVAPYVAAATVCVSSSVGSEENSRAVGEYLAAGRPVVATRVGVLPELLGDGRGGRLVPPGDPGAMGEALVEVLADPPGARRMARAGRESAARHLSSEAFGEALEGVLASVGVRR